MASEIEEQTMAVDVAEAVRSLVAAVISITHEQRLAREMLAKLLKEREQLTELVTNLNIKVATLAALVDSDHAVLANLAGLPVRPKGDRSVN